MVDLDDLDKAKSGGSDKKESSSSPSSSSSKSKSKDTGGELGGGDPDVGAESGTFSLGEDELMDPEGKKMTNTAKEWAEEGADLNYDKGANGSFKSYANQQVAEVQELHDNIEEMLLDHNDTFDEFTLYFHALFFNFAQNRVGIAETIHNQFDVSRGEAVKRANRICQQAGEDEMIEELLSEMTKNLANL